MKKIIAVAAGAALLAASSIGMAMPASAAMGRMGHGPAGHPDPAREQAMVLRWCHSHPRESSCRDFDHRHHHWSDAQYHSWYQSHYRMHGFDPGAAAIFGFGAVLGSAMAHSNR